MVGTVTDPLLGEFFANCPDQLFITSAEGRLLHANAASRRILGSAVEDGATLAALAHPEDQAALAAAWSKLQQGDEPVSLTVRLRAEREAYQPLALHAKRSPDSGAIFGSLRAVPEVAGEDRSSVLLKARILDAIVEHVEPILIWAVQRDGSYIYHEGKARERAGIGDHVGRNMFLLYGNTPESRAHLEGWFHEKSVRFSGEIDGIHLDNWIAALRDERGDLGNCILGFSFDVSDSKLVEQELRLRLDQIKTQQQVIRDLSTPIIEVWDGVLTLPMVGTVDSVRTAEVMDSLLSRIVEKHARFAILDLTGVEVVDTRVASHLIELVTAIRLLGADGIVAGIKANVAQTIVSLGLDLSQLNTQRDLRAALRYAIREMNKTARAPQPKGAPE